MSHKILGLPGLSGLLGIMLIFILILDTGCQFRRGLTSIADPMPPRAGKTVVLGFRPAMSEGEEAGVIRCPLSGAVFMAEPISPEVPYKMTAKLFKMLKDSEEFELVDLDKEAGILASLMSSGQGASDIETFKQIGHEFSAESVLVGYIYRWQERKGSDYSVERPASAAFDLYLLRSEDGAILWKASFDQTQASFSENIFDRTFFRGKGKWMTVESLSDLGLSDMLDRSLK